MAIKSEDDFRRSFDPKHELAPTPVFDYKIPKGVNTFIIVAAQNATPLEEDWWRLLRGMADLKKAALIVIPLRYKNPTSLWSASQKNAEYWDPELAPFLCSVRLKLHKHLTVVGDIKIPPTKSSPLSGLDAMSSSDSSIFGHPKLQMRVVPVPAGRMGKILTTTGVCTVPNYTDSALGKIGAFHHSYSATLVELDGKRFHLRQLHYDSHEKRCIDIGTQYLLNGTVVETPAPRALALVQGDLHVGFIDPNVERGREDLTKRVRPLLRVWHDVLDSYSCTPHHLGNPFITQTKTAAGRGDVEAEVAQALDYIRAQREAHPDECQLLVPSNHDNMLKRWMLREDWKSMSVSNAMFYLRLARRMLKGARMEKNGVYYPDPFIMLFRDHFPDDWARALEVDESYTAGDIELGMHGDIGPNGVRGSRMNLRRIGTKSVIGHGHSPGIEEGCYQTGTSTYLRLEYNHGASGWMNTDCVVNADGKRQLITYIDGYYTSTQEKKRGR
jgi:hypothetical protein